MGGKELPADGVVTGRGRIAGRPVHVASQDFTVAGGSAGEVHANKIADTMKASMKTGTPFVFINDSGGARVQEGVGSLAGYARIFHQNVMLSGVVPQISLICGPCAGGAAYSPALTDFIIQTRDGLIFITGPAVIKQVTGEIVSAQELGGVRAQMNKSGRGALRGGERRGGGADLQAAALVSARPTIRRIRRTREPDEGRMYEPRLNSVVPLEAKTGYDVRDVISLIVDHADFLEVQAEFARNLVVGFGRIRGATVGIVANQPKVLAGALDIDASDKGAGFVRFCNAFNIPLVTFVDIPGFLPGVDQEYGGIIRHGAKLLFAYSAATVPKITVILRKAYGGGYIAMCAKDLGADCTLAWPSAEIAVMGAEAAVEIVFHRELAEAEDAEGEAAGIDPAIPRDLLHAVCRRRIPPGRRHHRAGADTRIPGRSAGCAFHQARLAAAKETRTDPVMSGEGQISDLHRAIVTAAVRAAVGERAVIRADRGGARGAVRGGARRRVASRDSHILAQLDRAAHERRRDSR